MIDFEMLRIEKLIEEREAYENEFFSMEPSFEVENIELDIIQFNSEEELENPFEIDDFFDNLRDEQLIREREVYEIQFFKNQNFEMIENDFLDKIIESYNEPEIPEPDFDWEYDDFSDPCPIEEPVFRKLRSCWCDVDYMPHDDNYYGGDCYFYPDGDLLGIYPL